ncbi:MAG: LLM class F420-dependent oxidoreductase [Actinobacteria bacterium 13_2_20CM_2_71_6]|nr:MAG: LLM class F420-dependent oxidoreductase [Actinobacteria bacterium 13_2_20CM_2_71_6]
MTIELGRVGIWSPSFTWGTDDRRAVAAELDGLGYGTLWLGSSAGDLRLVEELLDATQRIVLATGIVNIWAYPAAELAANAHRLATRYPGRFMLGLGASHAPQVEALGRTYRQPLRQLAGYLDELDRARHPVPVGHRVLAALRPKALALAAQHSAGAHPYLVTPAHTELARRELGPQPLLAPEQKVVLAPDRAEARALARQNLAYYLRLPNYVRNLQALGFTADDLADGGSDRLVDGLFAWGVDGAVQRVREHHDAGADHVAVQAITPEVDPGTRSGRPALAEWKELAAALA